MSPKNQTRPPLTHARVLQALQDGKILALYLDSRKSYVYVKVHGLAPFLIRLGADDATLVDKYSSGLLQIIMGLGRCELVDQVVDWSGGGSADYADDGGEPLTVVPIQAREDTGSERWKLKCSPRMLAD